MFNKEFFLKRLQANAIEAGITPSGHFYEIKRYFADKSLCYTLYNSRGEKIPCSTRAQEKAYPKKSAKFASERLKNLEASERQARFL